MPFTPLPIATTPPISTFLDQFCLFLNLIGMELHIMYSFHGDLFKNTKLDHVNPLLKTFNGSLLLLE